MCEIEKGDYIKIKKTKEIVNVLEISATNKKLKVVGVCGLSSDWFIVECKDVVTINQDYVLSNRHRLSIRIKESGFDATDLSLAAGKNKFYFGTETKESRFNKHGDLSEKQTVLLFGRLEQAIKKLENPTVDMPTTKQNFSLEAKTSFEELKPSAYDLGGLSIKQNQDLAKTNEQAEKNFARILILACLILTLFFTVKINFF